VLENADLISSCQVSAKVRLYRDSLAIHCVLVSSGVVSPIVDHGH
jgi:hypothetical protein